MYRFRTTDNIFRDNATLEYFDENWSNYPTLMLPEKKTWDYSRELTIQDVDIWEVIFEQNKGIGVYAAWSPYAEFYIVKVGWDLEKKGWGVETYYGAGAQESVQERMTQMGMPILTNKHWVEPEDMWLYQKPELSKSIIV
jgi:hypothetical protein